MPSRQKESERMARTRHAHPTVIDPDEAGLSRIMAGLSRRMAGLCLCDLLRSVESDDEHTAPLIESVNLGVRYTCILDDALELRRTVQHHFRVSRRRGTSRHMSCRRRRAVVQITWIRERPELKWKWKNSYGSYTINALV